MSTGCDLEVKAIRENKDTTLLINRYQRIAREALRRRCRESRVLAMRKGHPRRTSPRRPQSVPKQKPFSISKRSEMLGP